MLRKQIKSAEEIKRFLEEALRRRDECVGTKIMRVYELSDGPSNWDVEIVADDGAMNAECKRVLLATKLSIQNRFELVVK